VKHTHVVGVDPGIVHTGVVSLDFRPTERMILVDHAVVLGPDSDYVGRLCRKLTDPAIFIEGYRARSNLSQDKKMQVAVSEMAKATKGKVLDNTGVKKIVKPAVLTALGVWKFGTPTHHDDLRSAARIAVLGMMKDPSMNQLLADVIRDYIDGQPWSIN
jgi:hypothetical protein